jgi:hypothetical protein
MERLKATFIKISIIMFFTINNTLSAQEWIDINKTPAVNYFKELSEAGKWVELIKSISLNPSTKINIVNIEKTFELFLNDESILIEIGHPLIKSTNMPKVMLQYLYRNRTTKETVLYVIYEVPSPRAFLSCYTKQGLIQYTYYEDRKEKYDIIQEWEKDRQEKRNQLEVHE